MPASFKICSVTFPTPGIARTGKERRNSALLRSGINVKPSGFWKSLAIFASNLLAAMPMVAVNPRSSRIRALSARATGTDAISAVSGSEALGTICVKSKYPSSMDTGSMTAPSVSRIAMMARDSSR